jgi:hypothetical protein
MKIKITLKDPDGVFESIKDAAESSMQNTEVLDLDEIAEIIESRQAKLAEQCATWIKYGEYVTIEIDTDTGSAIVCKA